MPRRRSAWQMESGGASADGSQVALVSSASSLSLTATAGATGTQMWPAEKSAYIRGDEIGQGATSLVFEATCPMMNNAKCALKVINLERCSSAASLDEINKEINAGKKLKHENVVQYYTSFLHETDLYIVMELAPRGSLHDYLKYLCSKRGLTNGALDENAIATILRDALRGLIYIHDNNLIHRDIKCGNLLVRADGAIQIADFGVAGALQGAIDVRHTFVGTPCWMAPEIMMIVLRAQKLWEEMDNRCGSGQVGYNQKADIWSLGITTLELAIGRAPLAEAQPLKILLTTVTSEPPSLEWVESRSKVPLNYSGYGQKYRKFVRCCLVHDPNKRATSKELLTHAFIKSKAKDRDFLLNRLFTSGDVPPPPSARQQHNRRQHAPVDRNSGGPDEPYSNEWDFRIEDDSDSSDDSACVAKVSASAPNQASGAKTERNPRSPPQERKSPVSAGPSSAPSKGPVQTAAPAGATAGGSAPMAVGIPDPTVETVAAPRSPVPPAAPSTAKLQVVTGPVEQPDSGPMTPFLMRLSATGETFPLTYKLILRKRFEKKDNPNETELRDVSFLFEPGRDTPETMARDLVEANLLLGTDYVLVAHNIDKIVRHPTRANPHTFQTNSGPMPPHQPSDIELHGYVRVTLKMPSEEEMLNKRAQEEARQQIPQQQQPPPSDANGAPSAQ